MKRRWFVKSSLLGSAALAMTPVVSNAKSSADSTEYFELRIYNIKYDYQQTLVEDYLKNAEIPALNRAGVKHVGVFTEMVYNRHARIIVIVQYKNLEQFNVVSDSFNGDEEYKTKGAAYLNPPVKKPAYERIESSLLKAFSHMPAMSVPENNFRIFELRQYQSVSEGTSKRKIDMFNNQGEIEIFKRLGFKPVFFGETVIGAERPNLTYMLTFEGLVEKDAHWKAFGDDAEWKKIKSLPQNADSEIVSKITSINMAPTDYSQI